MPGAAEVIVAHSVPTRQDNPAAAPVAPPMGRYAIDDPRDVYAVEADAFAEAVFGLRPPFVTGPETIGNMECIERVRKEIGAFPAH